MKKLYIKDELFLRIILILLYPIWFFIVYIFCRNFKEFKEGIMFPFEKWSKAKLFRVL